MSTVADDILWGLADHEGSIRQIIDNTGTILESRDYDAYGVMTVTGTADLTDEFAQSYTGRPWDADLELYQNRARWYDPAMGRFISVDPSGFGGGDANLYRYCNNSAINYNDPTGLCTSAYSGSFNSDPYGLWSLDRYFDSATSHSNSNTYSNSFESTLSSLNQSVSYVQSNPLGELLDLEFAT